MSLDESAPQEDVKLAIVGSALAVLIGLAGMYGRDRALRRRRA